MPFSSIKPYLALGRKCQNYPQEAPAFQGESRHFEFRYKGFGNSVTFPTLPGTTWSMDRGLTFSSSYKPGFSLFSRDEQKVHRMDLRFRIFVGEPEDERGPVLVTDRKSSPQRSNHHMHQPIMESLDREVPCCL